MNTDSNKALMRRYYEEVWAKADKGAERELVAEDVVDHMPMPGQAPGRAGHTQILDMVAGAFPDRRFAIEDLIAEGDKVVGRWTMNATHSGAMMGIPATGKAVQMSGMDCGRWRDGKLVELWHIEDMLGMWMQLGLVNMPG